VKLQADSKSLALRYSSASYSEKLVFSGNDNAIGLYNVKTHEELQTFKCHSERVVSMVFSPDGRGLASGSEDGIVQLWDMATGEGSQIVSHCDEISDIAFSPDSQMVAAGSDDGVVILWDDIKSTMRKCQRASVSMVCSLGFSSNGQVVASCHSNGSVIFWKVDTGRAIVTYYRRLNDQ
jgi:WD40 repeat protein